MNPRTPTLRPVLLALLVVAMLAATAACAARRSEAAEAVVPDPADTLARPPAEAAATAAPLVGVNQQWDSQADFSRLLSSDDLRRLGDAGSRAVRLPVRCHVVRACSYERRNDDAIDYRTVTTWDFRQLDRAVQHVLDQGMTPIIGLHPGDRMSRPGWIIDDPMWASTQAFVDQVVGHLAGRFGPLPYSMYETDLNTALQKVGATDDAAYHYRLAKGFSQWPVALAALYGGDLDALNRTWGTAYPSFALIPVPDLGSIAGVPPTVFDNPAAHDLRRVVGRLSADRYSALGVAIHERSPGSEFWGPTVQIQSFHDRRQVHSATTLTSLGPTLSDLASRPGIDVLSVDGYRNDDADVAAAEWQIAAKIAHLHGKQVAITEIGDPTAAGLATAARAVRAGGSNLHAVLVWEGRDRLGRNGYGLLDSMGLPKPDGRLDTVRELFSALTQDRRFRTYRPGTEAVYYPEWSAQVVQNGKLGFSKPLRLMADLVAAGIRPEPATDGEIVDGRQWPRLSIFSFYVGFDTAFVLADSGQPLVGYQYASYRTGFSGGRPVDLPLWRARLGIRSSRAEWRARTPETVELDGRRILVDRATSLDGAPFVHLLDDAGHPSFGLRQSGAPMGVRVADGSIWLDMYPGAAAVGVIHD